MDFARFDTRRYPTLTPERGYAVWAPTYDADMRRTPIDRPLLDRVRGMPFRTIRTAVDLGCGTGRMGRWLRTKGVRQVDGVDRSRPMMRFARRAEYRRLRTATVSRTGFAADAYDLAISSLVACHLPDLRSFYRELARLVHPGGRAIVVDYHPHFLLNGIPTHFPSKTGTPLAIRNHVHLLADHVRAAAGAGWRLDDLDERTVPRPWLRTNPGWTRHLHRPVSFMMVLSRPGGGHP